MGDCDIRGLYGGLWGWGEKLGMEGRVGGGTVGGIWGKEIRIGRDMEREEVSS